MQNDSLFGKRFDATSISLIYGIDTTDEQLRQERLAQFVETYQAPLIADLVYCKNIERHQAQDMVHEFFAVKLLSEPNKPTNLIELFRRKKSQQPGLKFRYYLRTSLRYFVTDIHRKRNRLPPHHSLDEASDMYANTCESTDIFDAEWASNLITRALLIVREECELANQQNVWSIFESRVVTPARNNVSPPSYAQLAHDLELASPKQASNLLVTGIRKFNRVLRELLGQYHDSSEAVEEELKDLRRIVATSGSSGIDALCDESSSILSMAEMLAIPEAPDSVWNDDVKDLWRHLIDTPLKQLVDVESQSIGDDVLHDTFRQFLTRKQPNLAVLTALKEDAKRSGNKKTSQRSHSRATDLPSCNGMPRTINGIVYLACIAAACLRHGTPITRDPYDRFVPKISLMLQLPWLDDITRDLLEEWREFIRAKQGSTCD